jgi:hypothetical protein
VGLWRAYRATATSSAKQIVARPVAPHERADAEQDREQGDLPGMNRLMPTSPASGRW